MTLRKTIQPLGFLADGAPFWAYFGAEGEDDGGGDNPGDGGENDEDGSEDEDEDNDSLDENGLNSRGRKAIESERNSAKRARDQYRPWGALSRELGMTPDQIREAIAGKASGKGEGEGQADAEEIRRQVTREVMEKANQRLIGAAVTAEAASLLRDPSDAARYLDLTDYHVDENGNVDSDEIRKDIRSLIRDKPYLGVARKGDGSGGGNPDFDGGARSGATGTVSMSDLIRNAAGYGRNRR